MSDPQPGLTVTGGGTEAEGVQTVFGRDGPAIEALPGDYDASQVVMQRGVGLTVKSALDAVSGTLSQLSNTQIQLTTLVGQLSTGAQILKRSTGPLSQHRVVYAVDATHIAAADARVRAHASRVCGISLAPAEDPEQDVEIVRAGEVDDASWSFTPDLPVFVGEDGQLTQAFDETWAYVRTVAVALTATKVLIDLRPPVFLAAQ